LSVVDLIALTRFGSREFGDSDADQAVVSPDRARVASVTQRGVLASNTREFQLLIVSNDKPGDSSVVNAYATFSTSTNRPAISQLTWLSNDRLAFLAERPDETPQVYTFDVSTQDMVQRTHAVEPITVFDASAEGRTIVYATERPQPAPSSFRSLREHGFAVPNSMPIADLVEGRWSRVTTTSSDTEVLHVARDGAETTVSLPDSATYGACELSGPYASESFSLAPNGKLVLLKCRPKQPPDSWALYLEKTFRREESSGAQYPWWIVLNLQTGAAQPLTGAAAMNFDAKPLWTADGESVIVLDDLSPLDGGSAIERNRRAATRLTVEIHLASRETELITDQRPMRLIQWIPKFSQLKLQIVGPSGTRSHFASFSKSKTGWIQKEASGGETAESAVRVHQGLNEPWRLVLEKPEATGTTLLYDPNTDLMAHRRLAEETVIRWQTKSGAQLSAGLYFPIGYERGKRYPLAIQTHGFEDNVFAPDGVSTTGFAAQPLAASGFVVVQGYKCYAHCDTPGRKQITEGEFIEQAFESLIDHLDDLSLIDRNRVALQGYSRSCYHELYFLTHSRYPIAAMTCTDGVDGSYMQFLVFGRENPGLADEFRSMNDGPPFGGTLTHWLKSAPGFNLDRIHAPVRLVALHSAGSLLEEWEPYAGLALQSKPVELFYLPEAIHNIVRPWDRFASQQGTVDWFRFWLQGFERTSPMADAEETSAALSAQYARWERLCGLQTVSRPAAAAYCVQPN
jgi:dipeptidyl aminopeptidase/acylaminoacyl peptidase